MELQTVSKIEKKARKSAGIDLMRLGIALIFIAVVVIYTMLKAEMSRTACFW